MVFLRRAARDERRISLALLTGLTLGSLAAAALAVAYGLSRS